MNVDGSSAATAVQDRAVSHSLRGAGETVPDAGRSAALVRICNLTKQYGDFLALSDCSIDVQSGSVFGLLGPNGAGKTTLIRSLLGFLKPTVGHATVCGLDPQKEGVELRKKVAYLPGDARLPRHMRGSGVLKFFSEMHPEGNLERSREIADRLELNQKRHVAFMSTGMRQKLALSVVLSLHTPLLILDEPTANLDPTIRAIVLDLVLEARAAKRTVIFSSHVLSEIEQTCDRVAFLRHGKLALELNMSDLRQRHRIWGLSKQPEINVPASISGADEISLGASTVGSTGELNNYTAGCKVKIVRQGEETGTHQKLYHQRIDLEGDLAGWLPWVQGLGLERMRIEPLGLRAVYDSVHFGEDGSLGGVS